jgi:DNA-binding MarR family transcriptional regulator
MSDQQHSGHQSRYRFPALEAILDISMAAEYLRHQVDKACAPLDINGGQYAILRLLKRAYPESMSRTEIVKNLIEKTTDVTRQIDSLEKKGFVERIRVKEDRRLSLARITDSGMEVMEKVDPLFFAMLTEISKTIDEQECKQLSMLCKKIFTPSSDTTR